MEIDNSKNYPIYIEHDFYKLKSLICNLNKTKILIITDKTVEKLYLKKILNMFSKEKNKIYYISLKEGEKSKNIKTTLKIYNFLLRNKFDRNSLIIALGGGVIGDISGFVASSFLRGISYIQVPTTLLSQVDSSIGGKVGIDYKNKKNIIGSFYFPLFVYININTLKSLTYDDFSSGISEVIKHGLIKDKNYFNYIMQNKERIKALQEDILYEIVLNSINIKYNIVKQDETDKFIRQTLNFGHTLGHALESSCNFKLSHGKCISLGIMGEMYISYLLNNISKEDIYITRNLLNFFLLPTKIIIKNPNIIYKYILFDKKNLNDCVHMALLKDIGNAYVETNISKNILYRSIYFIKKNV